MDAWISTLLHWLALPELGLSTVFVIALLSATLLPMGSEAAVLGLLHLRPDLFWPAIAVATLGNTLGGMVSWWMGRLACRAWQATHPMTAQDGNPPPKRSRHEQLAQRWLARWGAKTCILSWLPIVGDPLCAVAGWLRLPFWPCSAYMAIGKFLRYVLMTSAALWALG